MWKGLQRSFYTAMYFFGRTPPTSSKIDQDFEEFEKTATISADDPLCDCLVKAGSTIIQCKTRRTSVCEAMGEMRPDVNALPQKVGFCKTLPKASG